MCVSSFNLLGLTVPEKSVTKNFNVWKLERKKNEEIKGWMRAAAWFWYTWYICPLSTCVPSFNILGLTVPEKNVMKIFIWKVTEWQNHRMTEGQGKSSIAPTFQSGAIKKNTNVVEANVMNISTKFQLHSPYGFWGDDFWIFFLQI